MNRLKKIILILLLTIVPQPVFCHLHASEPGDMIVNEIHADPDTVEGDANGDGVRHSSDDEFIEIVNVSGFDIDISGWTLSDVSSVRHIFPPNTVVPDACSMVVFGGGVPVGYFGGSLIQTASTARLGLNNSGDTVSLNDGAANIAEYTYGSEGGDNQAITRDPDISGVFVKHSTVSGSGGTLFSPGTKVDGSLFTGCDESTLIRLSSFAAYPLNRQSILRWSTESEIDNAGFNVYRYDDETGEYMQINDDLIPVDGSPTEGASYEFVDDDLKNRKAYYYKLGDVDLEGKTTMHGPVSAVPRIVHGGNR